MDRFTRYEPDRHGKERLTHRPGFRIRQARPDDLESLATLSWQRNGGGLDQETSNMRRAISRSMSSDQRLLLVADLDQTCVAYGKARFHKQAPGAPENAAPEGWYLSGLVVGESYQRRGVGEALTRSRLAWLQLRCREVFYLANARNQASIDLHDRLGFREVTRDFDYPRVTFDGGEGILFRVRLPLFSGVVGKPV